MRSDLASIVGQFLEGVAVPPVLCSEYSAFDALSEILSEEVFGRADCVENPKPDVYAFEATVKTKEPTYSVADVRSVIEKAHLSSGGARKTFVLFDADCMTPEAANAFLKTLEDVPPNTFFILTVTNRGKLLETVLSRCLFIDSNDSALVPSDRAKEAVAAFFERNDFAPLAEFAFSKPDRSECLGALSCLSDRIRSGDVRDSETASAIAAAFSTIASTNVVPFWELDRVLLRLAATKAERGR